LDAAANSVSATASAGRSKNREEGQAMTKYMILFGAHAMDHIPEEDMGAVAKAAHAVCQEAIDAGVYVLAGGLADQQSSIVSPNGAIADGPSPDAISGITVVDVPTRQDALTWAAKVATACRCAQQVREIRADPELEAMLHGAGR
jgi:hypothetical protein